MYIKVRLLKGFKEPLIYRVPADWDTTDLQGSIVGVPVRNKIHPATVVAILDELPFVPSYEIKFADRMEILPEDNHYQDFINHLSRHYQIDRIYFLRRIKQFLQQKNTEAKKKESQQLQETTVVELTQEQQEVVNFCIPHIQQPTFQPVVLHGVTGSGKTEVYKKLIAQALDNKKTVILLLPEVTLALNFEHLLKSQLPSYTIIGFHSASSVKEKKELWNCLITQKPVLIIGVHLPVLLPISNLGLIIIDEEHEVGFQEKKHPRINSKEAALYRAKLTGIPIVLGSATPSMATLYNVRTKGWNLFQLKHRFAGEFPTIDVILLPDKKQRRNFWISTKLEAAIKDRLEKKEQTIIFINRRGYSFFVQCGSCSFVFQCASCSVSLTLHGYNQLQCHYCGYACLLPNKCPTCKAGESSYIKKGIGTQQVVSIMEQLFPTARIARADLDTTTQKKEWQKTVRDMEQGDIDILVGTQTITKGYHFPHVTLVGILWADLNLNFPIYNAGEITLAQLIQVAGRAGRVRKGSTVIVQTMIDHPIFKHLNEIDYLKYYDQEIEKRIMLGYPPYKRLVEIEIKGSNEQQLDTEAEELVLRLLAEKNKIDAGMQILGPSKPPVHTIAQMHRRKIYIKGEQIFKIAELFKKVKKSDFNSRIFFTPNPLSM